MSKKKLSFKDLILFLVGFLGVSITALCIGFFVLPLVLDSPQTSTVSVEQVDTTPPAQQKEEVQAKEPPPPPKPNVSLTTQKKSMTVKCSEENTGEGQNVEIFLESAQTCSVSFDDTTVKVRLSPDEKYFCFFDEGSSCRTEKEHQEVQAEKSQKKIEAEASQKKAATAKKSTRKNLKNEAEIIVTGPATLTISADSEAIIFVDGKKIRKAPLFKYDVSPGAHKVDIISQVDFKKRKTFTLQTESGMNYIRQWSFQDNTWLKKIP